MNNMDIINSDFEISMIKRKNWSEMPDTHFHDSYELYYLLEGEVYYFIENTVYTVKKGDMVLIPPHIIHKTRSAESPNSKRILVSFRKEFIEQFILDDNKILDCFNFKIITLPRQIKSNVENILNQLLNEFCGLFETNYILVKCLLMQLLILLNRNTKSDSKNLKMQLPEKVQEIIEYINKEFTEDITLESLSEKFYLSSAHLSRIFKSSTGITFNEYLTNVRVKNAVTLLLDSNLNITEIAYGIGYNSSNHFCKTFKRTMGISPLQYKKKMNS